MYKDNSISYKMMSVHFDRINIVNCFESHNKSRNQVCNQDFELIDNNIVEVKKIKYSVDDKLSVQTKNKISKAIRYINFVSENKKVYNHHTSRSINFKIAFVTLTLSSPQIHSDNEIKSKLLNQLFVELKKYYKVEHYVWRCEKQLNGNVHFHILVDKFLPHEELKELWNRIQNKLGYVDRYSERMRKLSYKEYTQLFINNKKYDKDKIKKAWIKGKSQQFRYPNSVDVHGLQYISNIDNYLFKYMSKDEQNKDIEGRLWGASRSIGNVQGARAIVDTDISNELEILYQSGYATFYNKDYYSICFIDILIVKQLKCYRIFDMYCEFLKQHFNIESS